MIDLGLFDDVITSLVFVIPPSRQELISNWPQCMADSIFITEIT